MLFNISRNLSAVEMIDKNVVLKFILNSFLFAFLLLIAYWLDAYEHKEVFFSIPINLIPLMFVLVYVHQRYLEV